MCVCVCVKVYEFFVLFCFVFYCIYVFIFLYLVKIIVMYGKRTCLPDCGIIGSCGVSCISDVVEAIFFVLSIRLSLGVLFLS